ncbi:predicted protein [Sclerotinia sclerotiorum 1980 UF-70]|uniref:Uncharacterized protein n=1 Tax=Sclerotinia sclerotiorum (strain ATCC 18683 / 1980 / Ss-1) TaxID=665079 RepID=A7EED0_SCLS1|nr:predicted protein [Sclerotinia sclerotiorum 1980 UF-70]EDO01196.1 predicted protein [Sclerotinia sclerotiorum 1980 UF-70]
MLREYGEGSRVAEWEKWEFHRRRDAYAVPSTWKWFGPSCHGTGA